MSIALNLNELVQESSTLPRQHKQVKAHAVLPYEKLTCVHQIMVLDLHELATCMPLMIPLGLGTGERRSRRERLAELLDFATEHFLNDAELAQQHAQNLLIENLYSEQYWVSSEPHTLHSS